MSASTIQAGKSTGVEQAKPSKVITWQRFQQRYLNREDAFKYEWVNGQVEKTRRSMDKSQLYILRNLLKHFRQIQTSKKISGELISEPDLFFLNNHRRPDICWLSDHQIDVLAEQGAYENPAFVIEVISSNDQINRVKHKLNDYRSSGVQVVWHIFPAYQQVEVYTGERLQFSTLYEGDQICSAAPALPDFQLPVSAIFQHEASSKHSGNKI